MSERNKFEEMLEKLVNEDRAGAEALFHEIVVEKSRDIYENLLEDDLEVDETTDEEVDEATDEEVDESSDEEVEESDEELEENFDLDEFEVEADPMDMDQSADFERDLEMPDMDADDDADDAEEGDMADDIADLQDEIEKLKAAFDAEMGSDMDSDDDEEGEEDDAEGDDGDEEEAPEEESFDLDVDEATDEEVEEADKSEAETMREYVEKVSATMGDNGANTKSPTASANKMGNGTSGNLTQGGESNSEGTKGGLADPTPKVDNMGNINVPGAKVGKTGMKAMSKGHGAEKKGAGETASDKKSIIGK